jgi:tetratricopeptide (TPR) repeat protein
MKRQLNTRLLAWIVGLGGLAAGVAFAIWLFQARTIAEAMRRQAEQAEQAENYAEALRFQQRYLSYHPDDIAAMAKYGFLLDRAADSEQARGRAVPIFERVLRQDERADAPTLPPAERAEIRRKLVELAVAAAEGARRDEGRAQMAARARPHLEKLLDEADPLDRPVAPADANAKDVGHLWALMGQLCQLEGRYGQAAPDGAAGRPDYDAAVRAFDRAIALDPHDVESYRRLAGLLHEQLKQPAAAERRMDEMIAANPDAAAAYLARARYRGSLQRWDEAVADAAEAVRLAPDDDQARLVSARLEMERPGGDLARARDHLHHAIAANSKNLAVYLTLVELELNRARDIEAAEQALRDGLKIEPDSLDLRMPLANLLIETRRLDEAEDEVRQLERAGLQAPLLGWLRARLPMARRRWPEARAQLEQVRPTMVSWSYWAMAADLDLARCYAELARLAQKPESGQSEETPEALEEKRLAVLRRAVGLQPDAPGPRGELVRALAARGDLDEAMRTARQGGGGAAIGDRLEYVRIAAEVALRLPPAQRNWQRVDRMLADLERDAPGALDVARLGAQIDVIRARDADARNRPDEAKQHMDSARRRLTAARDANAEDPAPWAVLADFERQAGRPSEALALLDEAERRLGPAVPELIEARAMFLAAQGGDAALAALRRLVPRREGLPPAGRDAVTEMLARALTQLGVPREALPLWAELAKRQPESRATATAYFEAAYRAGDDAAMRAAVAALRRIDGEKGTTWRAAEAARLAAAARAGDTKAPAAAHALLAEIRRSDPGNGRADLVEAELAEATGAPEAAIAAYRAALDHDEIQPAAVRRLVQLLYERKDYAGADAAIRALAAAGIAEGPLRRLAAEVSLGTGDTEAARHAADAARRLVPADSKDWRDQVWLGQMLMAAGETDEALAALRQAVATAPDVPAARLALVEGLLRAGKPAEAATALDEAAKALPADRGTALLARGYELLGRPERAGALYEQAVARRGDAETLRDAARYFLTHSRLDRAAAVLRQFIDPAAKAGEADLAWARRNLAFILATTGGPADEALRLIEANLARNPGSADDLTIKADVLAARPPAGPEGRAAVAAAIAAAEKAGPLPAAHRYFLAQRLEAAGDWPAATRQLRVLAEEQPDQPAYRVALVQALIRHRQPDEAAEALKPLETAQADTLGLAMLQAQVLRARGRAAEAVAVLRKQAQDHPDRTTAVAAALEGFGASDDAEALLRRRVAEKAGTPADRLALAGLLGRQGRTDEALDQCDAVRKAGKPGDAQAALLTAVAVINGSQASGDATRRVAAWIDELEGRPGARSGALRNLRATLLGMEGRLDEAETLYRQSLAEDPRDVMALNNLAWLLAVAGGRADEALELIERAIKAAGPDPSLLDTKAVVHLALNQPEAAVADLQTALAAKPRPLLYFHLARAHRAAGRREAAVAALQQAEQLGLRPGDVDPLERPAYAEVVADLRRAG